MNTVVARKLWQPPAGAVGLRLTLVTMIHTLGQGMWLALNAIYITTVVGLSPAEFGIGVSVSAAIALFLSGPMGHLADRVGPRIVQTIAFAALGPAILLVLLVDGLASYIAVMAVYAIAYAASRSARKAMIVGSLAPNERVETRAYLRAASNISVAVGAAMAGAVLAVNEPWIYQCSLVLIAASFAATSAISTRLPHVPPQPRTPGAASAVLRDKRYLLFAVLDGVLSSHALMLEVAIPLWIMANTDAPLWSVTVVLLLNTAIVVLFQVRAARGVDGVRRAAVVGRQGGLLVSIACVILAFTAGTSGIATMLVLIGAALVHAVGELRHAVGSWGVSFDLAPPEQAGQYLGTHAMGSDVAKMIAPALFTWALLSHGAAGWIGLGVLYAVCALAIPWSVGHPASRPR